VIAKTKSRNFSEEGLKTPTFWRIKKQLTKERHFHVKINNVFVEEADDKMCLPHNHVGYLQLVQLSVGGKHSVN
jgi:hypothetical protein